MDYHRYGSLGVGSVPPLIPGAPSVAGSGLPDHVAAAVSGAGSLPVGGSPMLQHHHHPSLMFHYGVGGKPPSLPPHLLPSPSGAMHNNSANLSSTISTAGNHNSTAYVTSKGMVSGLERVTSTGPGLGSSVTPLTTTAGSGRSVSPNSSSFAAALRTLAKQATGPLVNELDGSYVDSNLRCSPKTVNSYAGTSNGPGMSIPPVVSMTPNQVHPILADVHKDVTPSILDMERMNMSEELLRGFQPYRAPDLSAVSPVTQAQLRATMPLDLGHSYPYSSLYPHPLTHQYRLEEQLYLERCGLIRPPLPAYGMSGLSSLYQSSPYLSTRFPPDIMQNSLSVLHPSSALLHERLKLEEDIRQREYEFEMRRERELERERGREREREREKDRRHKEQHESDKREERQKASETLRDRSPLSHSSLSLTNSNSTASSSLANSNSLKKGSASSSSSHQPSRSIDRSKHDQPSISGKPQESNPRHDSSRLVGSVKQRPPTIVRPFESVSTAVAPIIVEDKDCKVIKDTHRDFTAVSNSPHKSVWQPVQLIEKEKAVTMTDASTVPAVTQSSILNGELPITSTVQSIPQPLSFTSIGSFLSQPSKHQSTALPDKAVPFKPAESPGSLQTSVIMAPVDLKVPISSDESKLSVKDSYIDQENVPSPFLSKPGETPISTSSEPSAVRIENPVCFEISSPEEPPPSPVSRLDLEEQRIRNLRQAGVDGDEAEDILFEEMLSCPTGFVCTKGPPVPLNDSIEKLNFLNMFELTTHQTAGDIKLGNCERRAKLLEPLVSPVDDETAPAEASCSADGLVPFVAPGLTLSEIPRLKGANSLLSDFPNKSRFLQKLGMHPLQAKLKQNEIDTMWLEVLEERLRRYGNADDKLSTELLPRVKKLLQSHRDKDSDDNINLRIKSPPLSPAMMQDTYGQLSEHAKTFGISSAKMQAALVDAGMKGFMADGLYGINNLLENDPLLSSMSGMDKMIERIVKTAETDNEAKGNSFLLKHIEEVRRSQVAVCQTAQLAQEQVAKLIKTRTQLETHRASLHHHLSVVSSLLAQTSGTTNETAKTSTQIITTTTTTTTSSSSFNISTLTRTTNNKSGNSSNQSAPIVSNWSSCQANSLCSNTNVTTSPMVSSWPALYSPFMPGSTLNDPKDSFLSPTKDQKVPIKSKPISTHSSSASKVSRTSVTKASKTISSCVNPGKFNGATNNVLSPLGSIVASTSNALPVSKPSAGVKVLPTSTFPPVAIGAVLGMSPSSQLFYVTTTAGSNNNLQQRSSSQNINKGNKMPSKPPINFTPYSKNSPSKVQNWLPNN